MTGQAHTVFMHFLSNRLHPFFLASDVAAIMGHTRQVIYLDDGEMVTLTPEGVQTMNINNEAITKEIQEITWDLGQIQKGGYEHFMLKEIFEQPQTIRDSFRGRILPESGRREAGRHPADRLGAAQHPAHHHPGLRHVVARRPGGRVPARGVRAHPGGGGVRLGVPLPLADHRAGHPVPGDQPERRDHRHPGGHARGQAQGRQGAGHHQRGGLDHRPRERVRRLHPRRARDRRGLDQGLHQPGDDPGPADHPARPAQPPERRPRHADAARNWSKLPDLVQKVLDQSDAIKRDRRGLRRPHATACTWGAG